MLQDKFRHVHITCTKWTWNNS